MATDVLARVDWQMGQTLLPEHLVAQEESLLADTMTRFRMSGLPYHGVGYLRWSDALLTDGTLSIQALTLVLPSGQLIDIPGNAAANTLNLNLTGTTTVPVYLHLTGERVPQAAEADAQWLEEGAQTTRVKHKVELSPDQTTAAAVQTVKLAEFVKDSEEVWSLSNRYVPPLLQVGTSPFLKGLLDELSQLIEQFHFKLEQEIAAAFLGGEGLFSAKLCLGGLYRVERFLANLSGQIHPHPYVLYEELKRFYTDLCLYQNTAPEHVATPYRHEELSECLGEIVRPLLDEIQVIRTKSPYVPFVRQEGLCVIEELPKEVRLAKEIYFLLQKPRVSDTIALEGVKLASRSRLKSVHQLSLHGIPFSKIERPPFQHQFGPEVEFYLLREGEEWDLALRDGTLAFYERAGLEEVNAHLYWRAG
ncbi:type VI secretion system baseplate subunit TssK [Planctomycetota bacterium]